MQNSDFRQKEHFLSPKKTFKFDQSKPFLDKLVALSSKLKKEKYKWTSVYDCSHIVILAGSKKIEILSF